MCWDEIRRVPARPRRRAAGSLWQAAAFFCSAPRRGQPSPIRELEMRFNGGFGVMFDDLARRRVYASRLGTFKRISFD